MLKREVENVTDCLRQHFGYEAFRGQQLEIILTLLNDDNAMVLMPTGGGKSLCYQIPSMLRSGVGVVVSPLIALMQDQVQHLQQNGIRAEFLNSTLNQAAQAAVQQQAIAGELDLLYLAPERLLTESGLALLQQLEIALFAIDEAHCVSQWGHDFRPEYTGLSKLIDTYPDIPRIALTATADDNTRNDIKTHLRLTGAQEFISSFDRPNIQYRIELKDNPRRQLMQFIHNEHPQASGIVYCLSRKKTEQTAEYLCDQGLNAVPYHAGMSAEQRKANLQRFIVEEHVIVVATVAFGMGIDKPDVRFVAHLDMPRSIESYYQETGRAGRDGLPATAWMVYGLQDSILFQQWLNQSEADASVVQLERHKLTAMSGLCESTECRRKTLLGYFGETLLEPCGNCDTCFTPPATWDATEVTRKALSAVYRTGQRFGTNYVIDVLQGNADDRIKRFGHDKLSVYGIGADLDAITWRSVFRQMIARSLVTTDLDSKGGLKLTEAARPILKGVETVSFRVETKTDSKRKTRKSRTSASVSGEDSALWEKLRETRMQIAKEQGIPAYVIFHDATLMEMMEKRPSTLEAMARISGVGAAKLEKYGEIFLNAINTADTESAGGLVTEGRHVDQQRLLKLIHNDVVGVSQLASELGATESAGHRAIRQLVRQGEIDAHAALQTIGATIDDEQMAEIEEELLACLDDDGPGVSSVHSRFSDVCSIEALRIVQAGVEFELEASG